MKINILLLFGVLMITSCSVMAPPSFLPPRENVGRETTGALVTLRGHHYSSIEGELIAVSNDSIYLLVKSYTDTCGKVQVWSKEEVVNYTIRYAIGKNYGWTIPVFTLLSLTHGVFALATLPMNWIVTGSLQSAAKKSVTFSKEQVGVEKLSMFARFPQGLPETVDRDQLRLNFPNCATK